MARIYFASLCEKSYLPLDNKCNQQFYFNLVSTNVDNFDKVNVWETRV